MKKQVAFIAMFILFLFGSTAQENQQKEISSEDRAKMFVNRLAQKIVLTKTQKDSVVMIYTQFMDDIQKYRAENNAKVITFMMKSRDEKIKKLLHDDSKFDKYLLFMEDIKKQRETQPRPTEQQPTGGQHNGITPVS
jgi:hypothetical protein